MLSCRLGERAMTQTKMVTVEDTRTITSLISLNQEMSQKVPIKYINKDLISESINDDRSTKKDPLDDIRLGTNACCAQHLQTHFDYIIT